MTVKSNPSGAINFTMYVKSSFAPDFGPFVVANATGSAFSVSSPMCRRSLVGTDTTYIGGAGGVMPNAITIDATITALRIR